MAAVPCDGAGAAVVPAPLGQVRSRVGSGDEVFASAGAAFGRLAGGCAAPRDVDSARLAGAGTVARAGGGASAVSAFGVISPTTASVSSTGCGDGAAAGIAATGGG